MEKKSYGKAIAVTYYGEHIIVCIEHNKEKTRPGGLEQKKRPHEPYPKVVLQTI